MRSKSLILLVIALVMLGCTTVYTIPIDDVYHWPGAYTKTTTTSSSSSSAEASGSTTTVAEPVESSSSTSEVEYINVQDTTVTIRIKK